MELKIELLYLQNEYNNRRKELTAIEDKIVEIKELLIIKTEEERIYNLKFPPKE